MTEPLTIDELAQLIDEVEASKLIVLTHPDDHDRIKAAIDARPDIAAGVHEVRGSQFLDPGQVITLPVGATRPRPIRH